MPPSATLLEALRLLTAAAWSRLEQLTTGAAAELRHAMEEGTAETPSVALLLRSLAVSPLLPCRPGDLEALYAREPLAACWVAMARSQLSVGLQRMLGRDTIGAVPDMRGAIHSLLTAGSSIGLELPQLDRERLLGCSKGLVNTLYSQQELQIALRAATLPQHLIFVLGMHRSGTSALSGMLVKAGYEAPRDLMPASEANPLGYWESLELMEINNRFLGRLHSHWSSVDPLPYGWTTSAAAAEWRSELLIALGGIFGNSANAVIKDPRFCVLMPGLEPWLQASLLRISFLLPVRHPLEVAASLQKSEQTPIEQGLRLWLSHTLTAEAASRGYPRLVVDFQRLLNQPAAMLEQCQELLRDPGEASAPSSADQAVAFIQPQLRRQRLAAATSPDGSDPRDDRQGEQAPSGAERPEAAEPHRGGHPLRSKPGLAGNNSLWRDLAEQVYAVLCDPELPASELPARLEPLRRQWSPSSAEPGSSGSGTPPIGLEPGSVVTLQGCS